MNIGEKIKTLRTKNGLSMDKLAEKIGVTKQAIFKYEQGILIPTLAVTKVLSEIFEISIDELVS